MVSNWFRADKSDCGRLCVDSVGEWKCLTLGFESWRFELGACLNGSSYTAFSLGDPSFCPEPSAIPWLAMAVKIRPAFTLLKIKKGQQSSVFMGCSKYM